MKKIFNNIRRIFSDDGRNDRDFTDQDRRLQIARKALLKEAADLQHAAELLADELKLRAP